MPDNLLHLITLQQAMDMLGVSRSTIDRWRRNRQLPFIKIGKEIMVDPHRLQAWVNEHAVVLNDADRSGQGNGEPEVVTIGYQSETAHMWSPLIIRELRLLDEELSTLQTRRPVRIEWRDAANGLKLVEGMIGGMVHIASLGDYPIALSQWMSGILPDFDPMLLAFDGKSPAGRGISLAVSDKENVHCMEDLSSAVICTVPHSSAGCRLNRLLDASGKRNMRIEHRGMKESWNGLLVHNIQASVMWEPFISMTRYTGAGNVLFESGIGEDYLTGIVANGRWARDHEAVVLAYLKAHLRAHRFMRDQPAEAGRIIASITGFPVAVTTAPIISRVRWDAAVYTKDLETLERLNGNPLPYTYPGDPYVPAFSSAPEYLEAAARSLSIPLIGSELTDSDWSPQVMY